MAATITNPTTAGSSPSREGLTQHFDALGPLSSREIHKAVVGEAVPPGSYLLVSGGDPALMIPLNRPTSHVGRGLNVDVYLDDASVSRRHAVILATDSGHRILDDRSTNGTYVNGLEVEEADLNDGDAIMLGRVGLVYRRV